MITVEGRVREDAPAAEAVILSLIDALQFYADPTTYLAIGFLPDHPCGDFIRDQSDTGEPYGWRMGARARAALEALPDITMSALLSQPQIEVGE